MSIFCKSCKSDLPAFEFLAAGGGGIYFEYTVSPDYATESEAARLCRFIDGYPCFACGTIDIAVVDVKLFLTYESDLPVGDRFCPVCNVACLGPHPLMCEAADDHLLAYIKYKYGAPLLGQLCPSCGRVWLSLHPNDVTGRQELVNYFSDTGKCACCATGHLRETQLDAPYSGIVSLYNWEQAQELDIVVAICDRCGEAFVRVKTSL